MAGNALWSSVLTTFVSKKRLLLLRSSEGGYSGDGVDPTRKDFPKVFAHRRRRLV